jgi:hypothetical protein
VVRNGKHARSGAEQGLQAPDRAFFLVTSQKTTLNTWVPMGVRLQKGP